MGGEALNEVAFPYSQGSRREKVFQYSVLIILIFNKHEKDECELKWSHVQQTAHLHIHF